MAHSFLLHNGEEFSEGGLVGPSLHKNGKYIGGGLSLTTSVRSTITCRLCSAGCSWTRSSWVADCREALAMSSVLSEWGAEWSVGCLVFCTWVQVFAARDALRYHAMGVLVVCGQTALVCPRSGRRWRHHPSGFVCTRSCVGLFALRSTSFVCGKNLVTGYWRSDFGSEQIGDGCGSDPGGTASYFAHRNVGCYLGLFPQTSHSAQRHTMQGKPRSGLFA